MEKSAEGKVGGATAEGPNDERQRIVTKRDGNASDHLSNQAAATLQDELAAGSSGQPESIHPQALLAQVLERVNLQRALKQVRPTKGAPGIDGMTVAELPDYLRHHWPEIRAQLEAGRDRPRPVKRVEIRPMNRKFLGFTVSRNGAKLKVADKAIEKLKDRVRELTRRPRGSGIGVLVAELRETLLGWKTKFQWSLTPALSALSEAAGTKAYFGIAEVLSPPREIDKWVRRKLRCNLCKQWGPAGYRELRKRGVTVRDAWNTSKSAHGPWRLSKTPALAIALPLRFFDTMGLPSLAPR